MGLVGLAGGLATASLGLAQEAVVISEFMAANAGTTFVDEDGDSSDWLELYNSGDSAVNLAGWFLTDQTNELTKWIFPVTNLDARGFMVVFASDKDRRVPGAPLHTNFKLDAGGGFLALVKPDGVTIASSFRYPAQRSGYSYGPGQLTQVAVLLATNSPGRVLVPTDGSLGSSWASHTFNDAAWLAGTNGVGYETHLPGFAVTNYKANIQVSSLTVAEGVITNPAQRTSVWVESAPVVNYVGTGAHGHYSGDRPFPGMASGTDFDDFVVGASGIVSIPAAGAWTFGVSSDDGFRLTVGSFTTNAPNPRSPSDTVAVWNFPAAGDYPIRLVYFERSGGSECELWAARGTFTGWAGPDFRLVGDVANGGLEVRSLPMTGVPGSGYSSLIRTDVRSQMLSNNASVYVRLPFQVTDAAAVESLYLNAKYDDGLVVYLNGTEVARRNVPATPVWNSSATAPHEGLTEERINLSGYRSLLFEGANVLAIQGLNVSSTDYDFFLQAQLADYRAQPQTNQFFTTPTPGWFNGSGFAGFVADTKFSVDRGFYDQPITVAITSETEGATIVYTLNGSWPSLTNGVIYAAPLLISNTTTLRAAAFRAGLVASDVDTHTYIFAADVIRQSPGNQAPGPGWPAANFTNDDGIQNYDYGMDPDIVNTPPWSATIQEDLKSLPTYSLVMALPDLFSTSTGIYANPSGDEITWERPCSLEFIKPDGSRGFQINCGVRIRGGYSRSQNNPKHAFRFFFRQTYGQAKLNYPLFGDQGAASFDKIDLRTMQNYCWSFNGDSRMICTRDQLSRDLQLAMSGIGERGDFCHLYLNGQYWGLYNTDERPEASFGETYFGGRAEDYDTIKVDPDLGYAIEATDGNQEAWTRLWRAATNGFDTLAAYFRIQGRNPDGTPNPAYENLLEVDDLIDYMLVILFGGNLDAPISNFISNNGPNNWFGVRNRTGLYGGFRFFAHDSEHTLLDVNADRTGIDYNGNIAWAAGNPLLQDPATALTKSSPQYVWFRLQRNPEFRLRVADHAQKHLFNAGVMTPQGFRTLFLARSNQIYRAMVCESARWGDAKVATPFTRDTWAGQMVSVNNSFINGRTAVLLAQLKADGFYPSNNAAPLFNHYGGLVPPGFSLFLTNANPDGAVLYTLDGSDPRLIGGAISGTALSYSPGAAIAISTFTRVKARARRNAGDWSALVEAQYYPSNDFSKLTVTELMYDPPRNGLISGEEYEFLELKNTGAATLDLSSLSFTAGITFTFTNGTRLAPGQFFVLGRNPAELASKYPGLVVHGVYSGKLANEGETLTLRHPVGGVVFNFQYHNAAPWPVTAAGLGFSLVSVNPDANPAPGHPNAWRASTYAGGSPGADDPSPVIAPVLINEILTHSGTNEVDRIELYNPNPAPVDIGGWFLSDQKGTPRKFRIPNGTVLGAGCYVVFSEHDFNASPDTNRNFALNAQGDSVYLFSGDAQTNLTGYSQGYSFDAAELGVSFGRYVNSAGEEHFVALSAPTFGTNNAPPKVGPLVVRQIMYHPPDLPGGVDDVFNEFVEMRNLSGQTVPLYDVNAPTNTWRLRGGADFNFPPGVSLAPGQSLLVVSFDAGNPALLAAFRARYGLFADVPAHGPYTGRLANDNESVQIQKPDPATPEGVPYVLVDKVSYRDSAPWPVAADGTGAALVRRSLPSYGNDPTNWTASVPLAILASPQPLTVRAGPGIPPTNATFTVTAIGDGPLTWQWRLHGTNLPEATAPTLTLTNVTSRQAGPYTVAVTDANGTALSTPALLTVLFNVVVVEQPQSVTLAVGSDLVLNVTVTNEATLPVSYRWRRSGSTLTNLLLESHTGQLVLTNIATNMFGPYTVVVTNLASGPSGQQLSSNAYVTVVIPPADQTVEMASNAAFTLRPFSPGQVRYQWQFAGQDLPGQTNATLILADVQTAQAGEYSVIVNVLTNRPIAPAVFAATLTVTGDQDGDGMLDRWEVAHGLNPDDPSDAVADPDGDGHTNLEEYQAGTNPNDPTSVLRLHAQAADAGEGVVLQFEALSNKTYTLQYRNLLGAGFWLGLTNLSPAAATNRTVVVTNQVPAASPRYYRVRIPQTP